MEPSLSRNILYRPKMGFAVPLARWFRGPLRERMRRALLDGELGGTGFFERRYLEHLIDAHVSGVRDYSSPLWALLMFEAFLRVGDNAATARRPHLMPAQVAPAMS
jgi:asparagine synthase (glutamine-hydrolysing)